MQKVIEQVDGAIAYIVTAAIGGFFTGCLWMIRMLLTNQRKIQILETEARNREEHRQRDREDVQDLKKMMSAHATSTSQKFETLNASIVQMLRDRSGQ